MGELDLASSPVLEERLAQLRATKSPVRLDLSKLEFVDSTGIRLLSSAIGESRMKHVELLIEPDVGPEVMRILRLVRMDQLVMHPSSGP